MRSHFPSVSIIIPAYNSAPYIGAAIASALKQTLPAEVIVVDDGSTDDTYLEAQRALGGKGKCLRQSHAGVSVARNTALALAEGEIVTFLDSDDLLRPEFLQRSLEPFPEGLGNLILAPNAYLWYAHKETPAQASRLLFQGLPLQLDGNLLYLKAHPVIHPLVARDFLLEAGGFAPHLEAQEDLDCYLRLLLKGGEIKFIPEPLWYYRVWKGSLSRRQSKLSLMENELQIYKKFSSQCTNPQWQKIARKQIRLLTLGRAYHALVEKLTHPAWTSPGDK